MAKKSTKTETIEKREPKVLLTEEGLKKLKDEYDDLVKVKRHEVTEKIARAREFGDLSENSEYDSAREEQSFIEGRIMELEEILTHAKVIEKTSENSVSIGSKVKVKIDNDVDEYTIVSSVEANPMEGKISNESPVGKALLGSKVGDEVKISTAVQATYKVLEVN
ncbi:MAG TPA: transcription elongation factor GreA [Candidatus Saccharimonadales bacterium]|nr:transcription elongation factor GreA [Candidatus Saccharimonadales bacterium]